MWIMLDIKFINILKHFIRKNIICTNVLNGFNQSLDKLVLFLSFSFIYRNNTQFTVFCIYSVNGCKYISNNCIWIFPIYICFLSIFHRTTFSHNNYVTVTYYMCVVHVVIWVMCKIMYKNDLMQWICLDKVYNSL